jgi:hypothetical protein
MGRGFPLVKLRSSNPAADRDIADQSAYPMKPSAKNPLFLLLSLSVLLAGGCDFPYAPSQQPYPGVDTTRIDTGAIGSGYLYPVNPGIQACNPSISQSDVFPASMLWLGFSDLSVKVPDTMTGFETVVTQHDRLTVVDTGNTVRWYIMRSAIDTRGELQCPEWSTHPDYLACLLGIQLQPYSGYAIRLSDKQFLKICEKRLEEFSTPHFWVPDSVTSTGTVAAPTFDTTGFIKKEYIQQFFGTTRFRFVYTLPANTGTLYYLDYSGAGEPTPVSLVKPAGKESWYCSSPLISPDGNWVTYHCFVNSSKGGYYSSYIQRLQPGSKAVLIADAASDPHWWVDPFTREYYIVYAVTTGDYFTEYDFSDPVIEATGVAGSTKKQHLKGSWMDGPEHMGGLFPDKDNAPYTLVRLPFKGGMSRDGYFLSTAYKLAYLMRLK